MSAPTTTAEDKYLFPEVDTAVSGRDFYESQIETDARQRIGALSIDMRKDTVRALAWIEELSSVMDQENPDALLPYFPVLHAVFQQKDHETFNEAPPATAMTVWPIVNEQEISAPKAVQNHWLGMIQKAVEAQERGRREMRPPMTLEQVTALGMKPMTFATEHEAAEWDAIMRDMANAKPEDPDFVCTT